jgi:hypothetical protein
MRRSKQRSFSDKRIRIAAAGKYRDHCPESMEIQDFDKPGADPWLKDSGRERYNAAKFD